MGNRTDPSMMLCEEKGQVIQGEEKKKKNPKKLNFFFLQVNAHQEFHFFRQPCPCCIGAWTLHSFYKTLQPMRETNKHFRTVQSCGQKYLNFICNMIWEPWWWWDQTICKPEVKLRKISFAELSVYHLEMF